MRANVGAGRQPVEHGFPSAERHGLRRVLRGQRPPGGALLPHRLRLAPGRLSRARRPARATAPATSWCRTRSASCSPRRLQPDDRHRRARPRCTATACATSRCGWTTPRRPGARPPAAARAACREPETLRDEHGEVRVAVDRASTATPSTPSSSAATTAAPSCPGSKRSTAEDTAGAAGGPEVHRPHGGQRGLGRDEPLGGFLPRRDGLPHVQALRRQGHLHRILRPDVEGDVERQRAREVPHQRAGRTASANRRSRSIWSTTAAPACSTSRMATDDIIDTVARAARGRACDFLRVPTTYYDDLLERVGTIDEPIDELAATRHPGGSRRRRLHAADLHRPWKTARRCSTKSSSAKAAAVSARATSRRSSRPSNANRPGAAICRRDRRLVHTGVTSMQKTKGYAAAAAKAPLAPFSFERREPGEHDVAIDIRVLRHLPLRHPPGPRRMGQLALPDGAGPRDRGRRHRGRRGGHAGSRPATRSASAASSIPAAPARTCRVGAGAVLRRRASASPTTAARRTATPTYGRLLRHRSSSTRTSSCASRTTSPLDAAAPLLCAGITLYSPLRHWNAGPGTQVGDRRPRRPRPHGRQDRRMRMGAEVTVLSHSLAQGGGRQAARRRRLLASSDRGRSRRCRRRFDLIINTVSAPPRLRHRTCSLLDRRRHAGAWSACPRSRSAGQRPSLLIGQRRRLAGSLHRRHRARRRRCSTSAAEHGIVADIEVIPIQKVNEAYERVIKSDVKYRFVIDMASLKNQ